MKKDRPHPGEAKPKRGKRDIITFEPPDDILQLLAAAEKATGASRTALIVEAIRTDLDNVVEKLVEQRDQALAQYRKVSKQNKKPAPYEITPEGQILNEGKPKKTAS